MFIFYCSSAVKPTCSCVSNRFTKMSVLVELVETGNCPADNLWKKNRLWLVHNLQNEESWCIYFDSNPGKKTFLLDPYWIKSIYMPGRVFVPKKAVRDTSIKRNSFIVCQVTLNKNVCLSFIVLQYLSVILFR